MRMPNHPNHSSVIGFIAPVFLVSGLVLLGKATLCVSHLLFVFFAQFSSGSQSTRVCTLVSGGERDQRLSHCFKLDCGLDWSLRRAVLPCCSRLSGCLQWSTDLLRVLNHVG